MKIILFHLVLLLVLCLALPFLFNVKYNENFATYPSNTDMTLSDASTVETSYMDASFVEGMKNRENLLYADVSFVQGIITRDNSLYTDVSHVDISFTDISFVEGMQNLGNSYFMYSNYNEEDSLKQDVLNKDSSVKFFNDNSNTKQGIPQGISSKSTYMDDVGTNIEGILENTKYTTSTNHPSCSGYKCGSNFGSCS